MSIRLYSVSWARLRFGGERPVADNGSRDLGNGDRVPFTRSCLTSGSDAERGDFGRIDRDRYGRQEQISVC